jgi:Ca2+-binding RTX toxin-like protein
MPSYAVARVLALACVLGAVTAAPALAQEPLPPEDACFADFPPLSNPNIVVGTPADEVLRGTRGSDIILGKGGNDVIEGLGGDDYLCGGAGADTLRGGPGNDVIDGADDRLRAEVEAGAPSTDLGDDIDVGAGFFNGAFGFDGGDFMSGGTGGDIMAGELGPDTILGRQGSDQLQGSPLFVSDPLPDLVSGGGGFDQIIDDDGNDVEKGGQDLDILFGGRGADTLIGGDGPDSLGEPLSISETEHLLETGDDNLLGGSGGDRLDGGPGRDRTNGENGFDLCRNGEIVLSCEGTLEDLLAPALSVQRPGPWPEAAQRRFWGPRVVLG